LEDVANEVTIPEDGTISRTVFESERLKVVLFGFAQGQELSEHTASVPGVLHFLEGEARVTLAEEVFGTRPGSWIHMPERLPHSVLAETPVKMLLLLLKDPAG
jgi:quercetin dioxygenase-like cupin family protein